MTAKQLTPRVPTHADDDDNDSLRKEQGDGFAKFRTMATRLEKMFGVGDNPQLRRKLYQRIQRCAIEHGPECYEVVRNCVGEAQSADIPARYFCVSITSELKSLGYWQHDPDF